MNILVIIEDSRGSMHRMSKEAIVGAQKMGGNITALVIGENADSISNELSSYNIGKTLLYEEILFLLIITPIIHRLVNILGFKLGLKDVPY